MAALPFSDDRDRTEWVLAHRDETLRAPLSPQIPYAFLNERERNKSDEIVPVATVFLTNRECPWRCLMCDLWKNTLTESVPPGAITAQVEYALKRLEPAREIKLYNSGSFFDRRAVPVADYQPIAARLDPFERVIVECHPSLVGDDCLRFRDLLRGRLEVAMGLETADPDVLRHLNKRMTTDLFMSAADRLHANEIDLRVFILVKPPLVSEEEAVPSAVRSLEFAFDCGASVAVLIPTRAGNGALETLADLGLFSPPRLQTLEKALEDGVALGRGRVFADLWNLDVFSGCDSCVAHRRGRLERMNLSQQIYPPVECAICSEEHAYEG